MAKRLEQILGDLDKPAPPKLPMEDQLSEWNYTICAVALAVLCKDAYLAQWYRASEFRLLLRPLYQIASTGASHLCVGKTSSHITDGSEISIPLQTLSRLTLAWNVSSMSKPTEDFTPISDDQMSHALSFMTQAAPKPTMPTCTTRANSSVVIADVESSSESDSNVETDDELYSRKIQCTTSNTAYIGCNITTLKDGESFTWKSEKFLSQAKYYVDVKIWDNVPALKNHSKSDSWLGLSPLRTLRLNYHYSEKSSSPIHTSERRMASDAARVRPLARTRLI